MCHLCRPAMHPLDPNPPAPPLHPPAPQPPTDPVASLCTLLLNLLNMGQLHLCAPSSTAAGSGRERTPPPTPHPHLCTHQHLAPPKEDLAACQWVRPTSTLHQVFISVFPPPWCPLFTPLTSCPPFPSSLPPPPPPLPGGAPCFSLGRTSSSRTHFRSGSVLVFCSAACAALCDTKQMLVDFL